MWKSNFDDVKLFFFEGFTILYLYLPLYVSVGMKYISTDGIPICHVRLQVMIKIVDQDKKCLTKTCNENK